jgi:hypothetical protein
MEGTARNWPQRSRRRSQHSLLAGRLAGLREQLAGVGAAEVQGMVTSRVHALLGTGAQVATDVTDDPERATRRTLTVQVRPQGAIPGRPIAVTLTVGVPR